MSFINKIRLTALFVIFAISLSCFTAQSQQLSNRKQGTVLEQLEQNSRNNLIDQVINYAYRFRGTPYRYGAMSPRGFDCSGFTRYCFKKVGVSLSRSAKGQGYNNGRKVSKSQLKAGDIVCFDTDPDDGDKCDHVGIYLGGGKFIHASSAAGKVVISSLSSGYYARVFSWGRRVL